MTEWTENTDHVDEDKLKYYMLEKKGRENVIFRNQALVHLDEVCNQLIKAQELVARMHNLPRTEPFVYQIHSMKVMVDDLYENLEKQFDADMWDHLDDPEIFKGRPMA